MTSRTLPEIGTPAPDFTAKSTSGEAVVLSAFRNESAVLLAFFPLAFTSTCTAELCEFSDNFDLFAGAGVTVLPISVDSVDSLREYRNKYGLHSHLLSDFRRTICAAYGVLNEEKFYSDRSYFLIDRAGILRWSYVEEHNGLRRTSAEILTEIAKVTGNAGESVNLSAGPA